jgi:hypothetical protein
MRADVAGCTLALASRQVRLHRATATAARLRVASHPVVEHCTGITCGPPRRVIQGVVTEEARAWSCALGRLLHIQAWACVSAVQCLTKTLADTWRVHSYFCSTGRAAVRAAARADAREARAARPRPGRCRVAPYALEYPGSAAHLAAAGLAADSGLWREVHDFCWLRAAPSPNWCAAAAREGCAGCSFGSRACARVWPCGVLPLQATRLHSFSLSLSARVAVL